MIFAKDKAKGKYILRVNITLNLPALKQWLISGEIEVPLASRAEWGDASTFDYQMFVLPAGHLDWVYHKNSGEFSHSVAAIVELERCFKSVGYADVRSSCGELWPDMEIDVWNGQLAISVCRKLILMAPLKEASFLIDGGITSDQHSYPSSKREIKVPTARDSNDRSVATEHMLIHESIDGRGVMYSNQLACVWMDSPRGPVVSKA